MFYGEVRNGFEAGKIHYAQEIETFLGLEMATLFQLNCPNFTCYYSLCMYADGYLQSLDRRDEDSVAHYLYSATGPAAESMAGLPMLLLLQLLLLGAGVRPGEPVREQNWWTSCLLGAVPGAPSPRIPAAPRRRGEIACRTHLLFT